MSDNRSMTEHSPLISLLIFYLVLWLLARFAHYSRGGGRRKFAAPLYIRRIFGSFAAEGQLDLRGVCMQVTSILMVLIGIVIDVTIGLNGEIAGALIPMGIFINVLLVFVAERLF